ncbi:hypothetical protein Glove_629g23 [Diversispora epigaea]|uniref:Uncharacterized protein n=1 Tax=Diversispora epigaea TaxID=1348612 RepID=A0A397GDQ0_9GLOM|nr:hypothetical protein Glove_629g23 [Diversispora epigaea]
MQSEIDLLKQKNTRLMTRISELEQIAKEKDELEVRIVELERFAKENIELRSRVVKLEQKLLQNDKEKTNFIVSQSEDASVSKLNDTEETEQIILQNKNTPASDISGNTSNCQEFLFQPETKSPENMEIDDFYDSVYKERISKEIIQNIKEKKLRDQEASLEKQNSLGELEKLISFLLSCDIKTVNTVYDQEKTLPKESIQNIFEKSIRDSAEADILLQAYFHTSHLWFF